MYSIFRDPYSIHDTGFTWPEFENIRRSYIRDLKEIKHYYHTRVYSVINSHFLTNILMNVTVPINYDNMRYVEAARVRAYSIAHMAGLSMPSSVGIVHKGNFYGPGCDEIYIYDDEYFDVGYVAENWREISALRVLQHPKSDLKMLLPNGKRYSSETGLVSISINIAMLSLQFKMFYIDQIAKSKEKGDVLTMSHFLHMYVLPNMLDSHMDIAIFNRLTNLYYGKPMGVGLFRHPFAIVDYTDKVDKILNKVLNRISSVQGSTVSIIRTIPTLIYPNMLDSLHMPDIAPTRQVWWALLLTRLDTCKFLLDVRSKVINGRNATDLYSLQFDLRRLLRDAVLQSVLKQELMFDVNETIEEILAM